MRRLYVLTLFLAICEGVCAAECVPTMQAAQLVTAARNRQQIVLEGAQAVSFSVEARAQGVPMPDADYVFLRLNDLVYEAEWLENARDRVSMACSWQATPASRFGQLIARWAKPT